MHHVVHVESSFNPYAIGVVGGHLVRQPRNLSEALATVRMLERRGFNFSLGLAQVNRHNLGKYGLDSYEKAFEICPNLEAGSRILAECHSRSSGDWGKSFSCYYSGNFVTGYRHGYVQKVFASMQGTGRMASPSAGIAIEVVSKPSRRTGNTAHYPTYPAERSAMQRITVAAIPQVFTPSPAAPTRDGAAPQPGQPSLQDGPMPVMDQAFVF